MKKTLISLLVILGIAAVAVVTCPDHQAHKDAISSVINEAINDELRSETEDQGISAFIGSLGSSVAGFLINSQLSVKNYFVYSAGWLKDYDGEKKLVSVGVFGHVFTFGKEDIRKAINE